MEVKIEVLCSDPKCGRSIIELDDAFCESCINALKDKILDLKKEIHESENKVYDLKKYIEKEEL